MINLWCILIINGRKKIDDIPLEIREQVFSRLKELGYNFNEE